MTTADRVCLAITHAQALSQVLAYESVAEEFGFEPYGTPAEQVESYNRHLATYQKQFKSRIADLERLIAEFEAGNVQR